MKCSECDSKFFIPDKVTWVYKRYITGIGNKYQCSYTCWRKCNIERFRKRETTFKNHIEQEELDCLWMR